MSEADLIRKFYEAFQRLDADTMAACYAEDAKFDDPAFDLRGREQVGGMWRMLSQAVKANGMDVWKLDFSGIRVDGDRGFAHWEPHYRYSATGRLVHNIIDAEFRFQNGLIVEHRDHFDLNRWAKQALGLMPVALLGWTPLLRNGVRKKAAEKLQRFLAR